MIIFAYFLPIAIIAFVVWIYTDAQGRDEERRAKIESENEALLAECKPFERERSVNDLVDAVVNLPPVVREEEVTMPVIGKPGSFSQFQLPLALVISALVLSGSIVWGMRNAQSKQIRTAEINFTNTITPTIVSLKTKEMGDTSARNEKLTRPLLTGDSISFTVPAPMKSQDADGVRCTVVVVVAEQWTTYAPGETVDSFVDENGKTKYRMTAAQLKEAEERKILPQSNSSWASFEWLHAGDVVNWDFDGKYLTLKVE